MYISFAHFSLKPGVSEEDIIKLFNESAIPIHRSLPEYISYDLMRYLPNGTETTR
ncbi:hypothetical protein GF312_02775 [Candidatus Poribacteria bacterium]|nr:hypothetical protein [Candidatus Poribacteria bacterium]